MTELGEPLPPAADDADSPAPPSPPESRWLWTPPPQPGELSSGWRLVTTVAWVGVVLAWVAVWNTSVQLGLSTWWLGARSDPSPLVIRLLPFAGPVVVIVGTLYNLRRLPWVGLAGALVLLGYGIADLGRVTRLGVLEVLIGAAALVVSAASFTGVYRSPQV